jgi:hypothetical protein
VSEFPYCAVDFGIRLVTICRLTADGTPTWHELKAEKGTDALEAARQIAASSWRWSWDTDCTWLERSMGRHIRSVSDLARVQGVVLATIPARIFVSEIQPPDWKRVHGLAGNAKKPVVMAWATDQLGEAPATQDMADAYAIAEALRISSERATSILDGDAA